MKVALAVTGNSELIQLVQALAAFEQQDLPEHALIGGVAVMTRLAQAHRVTLDVDQVLRETVPSTVDVLIARQAAQRVGSRVELLGESGSTSSPRWIGLSLTRTFPRTTPTGSSCWRTSGPW